MFNGKFPKLVMWNLYACLMKILRAWYCGPSMHVEEDFQSWSRGPSMINKMVSVGHVDPICILNDKYSELVMWTLYACLMRNVQSWSCGLSMHV